MRLDEVKNLLLHLYSLSMALSKRLLLPNLSITNHQQALLQYWVLAYYYGCVERER